jgi:hypothetical protein
MSADTLIQTLLVQLAPDHIEALGERELMTVLATIWADVELAERLDGSEAFVWERLLHYAGRGYLTAQELQGIRRTLALPYHRQLQSLARDRATDERGEATWDADDGHQNPPLPAGVLADD